jgi:polyisoprenoid-binding protein YceI
MAQWKLDSAHTMAEFSAKHMMITTVRGAFRNITGTINYDADHPETSSVEVVINTNEITSTGVQQRDDHLKSGDFLEIEKYPTITFKSTKVEPYDGGQKAKITGDLTIKDVTRPVVLDAEFIGQLNNSPFGDTRVGFTGSTKINREDFGLTWNMALEAGGWLVGKDVNINLEVEAILVPETAAV